MRSESWGERTTHGNWLTTRRRFTPTAMADPAARPQKSPRSCRRSSIRSSFADTWNRPAQPETIAVRSAFPSVKWDIDRDGSLDAALLDTRKLSAFLADGYRLDDDDLIARVQRIEGVSRRAAGRLDGRADTRSKHDLSPVRRTSEANDIGVKIDTGVYDKVRPFRCWNSRHPRTGLHKIRIDLDDLLVASTASITSRAVGADPVRPADPCSVAFAGVPLGS